MGGHREFRGLILFLICPSYEGSLVFERDGEEKNEPKTLVLRESSCGLLYLIPYCWDFVDSDQWYIRKKKFLSIAIFGHEQ